MGRGQSTFSSRDVGTVHLTHRRIVDHFRAAQVGPVTFETA
jgi:hypothetical protein